MRSKIFNPATGEFDEIFDQKNYAREDQSGMSIIIPRGEIGPRGLPGKDGESIVGPAGKDGIDGNKIYCGETFEQIIGKKGDIFINKTTGDVYQWED